MRLLGYGAGFRCLWEPKLIFPNHRFERSCEILVCKSTLVLYLLQVSTDLGRTSHCYPESTVYLCSENDKTFITVEKVICIIYAVFSTIISDILDRFYFQLSYLIHAWKINFISFIYLPMLKLSFKSSSSEQFDCCSCISLITSQEGQY